MCSGSGAGMKSGVLKKICEFRIGTVGFALLWSRFLFLFFGPVPSWSSFSDVLLKKTCSRDFSNSVKVRWVFALLQGRPFWGPESALSLCNWFSDVLWKKTC